MPTDDENGEIAVVFQLGFNTSLFHPVHAGKLLVVRHPPWAAMEHMFLVSSESLEAGIDGKDGPLSVLMDEPHEALARSDDGLEPKECLNPLDLAIAIDGGDLWLPPRGTEVEGEFLDSKSVLGPGAVA